MTPEDIEVRNATYRLFVDRGRAPTSDEVGDAIGQGSGDVLAAWQRLHAAHALVLDGLGGLRMLNPFSAVPTPYRVEAGGRSWFGNCGWDAFGIGAALHVDSVIHATCPDCAEALDIEVRDGRPTAGSDGVVFHVVQPARDWWNDIGFT